VSYLSALSFDILETSLYYSKTKAQLLWT